MRRCDCGHKKTTSSWNRARAHHSGTIDPKPMFVRHHRHHDFVFGLGFLREMPTKHCACMQSVLLWNWPSGVAISRFSSHQTPDWITSSYSRHPKNCNTTTEAHNISPRRWDYPLWIKSYFWPVLQLSHLFGSSRNIYKWWRFISHFFESIVHVSLYSIFYLREM